MIKMDSTVVAYITDNIAGFALYDNDIELNMKIDLAAPTAETTGVTLVLTMTDVDAPDKTYTAEITGTATTANLAREMGVMYHRGAKITLNVQPEKYEKLGFHSFGITEETVHESTGWDYQIPSYTAGEGNLNKVEFNGVVNFSSQYGTMGDGSVGNTALVFGEKEAEDKGIGIYTVPSRKWDDGSGYIMIKMDSTVVAYITDNIAGFALYDNDIELNLKIDLAAPTAETTGVALVLTMTDVDAPDKTYTAEITGTATTANLAREMGVMYHRGAKITLKPTEWDGAALQVGDGIKTDISKIVVEQGDELPTGYTADGKYILSWTADGSAVTAYDKTKSNYVAKFVDTKMLKVAKQHKVEDDGTKSVRFIATLDKLEGYTEAGFIFANQAVEGELTEANGKRLH